MARSFYSSLWGRTLLDELMLGVELSDLGSLWCAQPKPRGHSPRDQGSYLSTRTSQGPGPGRPSTQFFFPPQKYWHLVGTSITQALVRISETGEIPPGWNESIIICLIPKTEALESLSQFWPISLCNVLIKVISNIFANRLKPIMDKLMGSCQSSFIIDRSTLDNILVAQEVIHSLHRRKGRRAGFWAKGGLGESLRSSWLVFS